MKRRKTENFIIRTILGIVILFLIVSLGYILSGVLGYSEIVGTEVNFKDSLLIVLSNPFADYYNSLTPISIILSIVVSEFITFLVMLFLKKRSGDNPDVESVNSDPDQNEEAENSATDDIEESEEKHEVQAEDLFRDIFSFEDVEETENSIPASQDMDLVEDDSFAFFIPGMEPNTEKREKQEEIRKQTYHYPVLDELVGEYSKEQIDAISKILQFMPDITEKKIKKMFRPELSADEISQYIEVLYE